MMSRSRRRHLVAGLAVLGLASSTSRAGAWIEHEHADLMLAALRRYRDVHPGRFRVLAQTWAKAVRARPEAGLCEDLLADPAAPQACIPLAALPMLAGDHSCSPGELAEVLVDETWPEAVVATASKTRADIHRIHLDQDLDDEERAQQIEEARRRMNFDLLIEDSDYVARAASNLSHFALARTSEAESLSDYTVRALGPGQRPNALGAYAIHHASALEAAARGDVFGAIIDEAFAIHFLQDSFAAGHIVGTAEKSSQQLFVHDHYSRHGVVATLWETPTAVAHPLGAVPGGVVPESYKASGDGFLGVEDTVVTAASTERSLLQLTAALQREPWVNGALAGWSAAHARAHFPDTCGEGAVMPGGFPDRFVGLVRDVVSAWPRPAVLTLPFEKLQTNYGLQLSLMGALGIGARYPLGAAVDEFYSAQFAAVGAGVGFTGEGVLESKTDSRFTLGGWIFYDSESLEITPGNNEASIGYAFSLRMPYHTIPGDVLAWGIPAAAGNTWGRRTAQRAFAGRNGLLGVPAIWMTSPFAVRFELGRSAVFVFSTRKFRRATGSERDLARWEVMLPIFAVGGKISSARVENDLGVQLFLNLGNRFAGSAASIDQVQLFEPHDGAYAGVTLAPVWGSHWFPF